MAGKTGLPTGTVTFLFSVNGDAALLEELGRTRYAALLAEHERLLTRVFAEHGGKAVDRRPDSVFFAFPSAGGAVTAAVQAQQALAAEGLAGDSRPRRLMGLAPGGPALLERESELAAVHAHVAAAVGGTGRLVAIEGRPGIGKTRLLTEARGAAARHGMTVLSARGGE